MRELLWMIFVGGVIAAGFLGGQTVAFIFLVAVVLVITLFRRALVLALTGLASRLGLMRATIERMPAAIRLTRAHGPADAARPILAALAASNFADAGAWNISEMPKIQAALMVQREEGMLPFRPLSVQEAPRLDEHLYADDIGFRKETGA